LTRPVCPAGGMIFLINRDIWHALRQATGLPHYQQLKKMNLLMGTFINQIFHYKTAEKIQFIH
jgi:hypothetical protein